MSRGFNFGPLSEAEVTHLRRALDRLGLYVLTEKASLAPNTILAVLSGNQPASMTRTKIRMLLAHLESGLGIK